MSNAAFTISLALCVGSALALNLLHFRMKFRLIGADLPVKWMMMPRDDWRMWNTYRTEAPARNWPLWPFYVYRALMPVFALSAIILMFNTDKLDRLLSRW